MASENNQSTTSPCPICGTASTIANKAVLTRDPKDNWWHIVNCPQCGRFNINDTELTDLQHNQDFKNWKNFASAWLYRNFKNGHIATVPTGDPRNIQEWKSQIMTSGLPSTVSEKKDALLLSLAEEVEKEGEDFEMPVAFHENIFIAETALKTFNELDSIINYLNENRYIAIINDTPECIITSSGWHRVEELRQVKSDSDTAFIAMWFDDTTVPFRETASAAIEEAGYKPVIVDQIEHNSFIMDQVIGSIKQARFIIADLTTAPEEDAAPHVKNGVRGGVYYEAGYAAGMGKQVIHTCRDDVESSKRLHFDVKQINTIFWDSDNTDDLKNKLVARILATVGKGPH